MHRRSWLAWFSGFLLVVSGVTVSGATAARAEEEVTLSDRLQSGLKTRRPEEKAFVESVVALVDQQKLTVDLVLGTYQWAVKQRPDFPFYYFKYGIKRRAAAIGVDI